MLSRAIKLRAVSFFSLRATQIHDSLQSTDRRPTDGHQSDNSRTNVQQTAKRFFSGAVLHNYPSPFQYGAEKIKKNYTFKITWSKNGLIRDVYLNNICPHVRTVICWYDNLDSSDPVFKSSIFTAVSQRNISLFVFSL